MTEEEQTKKAITNVSKKSIECIKKHLIDEIKNLGTENEIKMCHMIALMIGTSISIVENLLFLIVENHKSQTGQNIDTHTILKIFIDGLSHNIQSHLDSGKE
jgi:hypothetical protein